MGGKPILAMNLVGFPIASMDKNILKDILRGGLAVMNEADTLLVGGHSIEDDELKYGLSVTGTVHPDHVLLNSGARIGDQLLLTKPIGTGILATALKGGLADQEVEARMTTCMATLNKTASEAMMGLAHGCTDITGFGLLGHLHEMAMGSQTSIQLQASALPLLDQTADFANMGMIPEGAHKNLKFYQQWLHSSLPTGDVFNLILADPQTSGGLLIAAAPPAMAQIQSSLAASTYPYSGVIIGEIVKGESGHISLL